MAEAGSPPPAQRAGFSLRADGRVEVNRVGFRRHVYTDLYHALLRTTWPRLLAIVAGAYVTINAVFAELYLLGGNAIAGARPGSFDDAFFFSVQTFATIGYGVFSPGTLYAHVLVTVEALVGILFTAMATGLMFAKFARPTARVLFSDVACVSVRDGKPTLHFRVANARENQIIEATARVTLSKASRTAEGETIRRFHDLRLQRDMTPVLALTWTIFHPLDEASPLCGETPASLAQAGAAVLVTLTGIDDTMGQGVHARYVYTADKLRFGHRFVDVLTTDEKGMVTLDYTKFHTTEPVPG